MNAEQYLERIENKRLNSTPLYSREEMIDFAEKYAKQLTLTDAINWVAFKNEQPPNETKRYITFKDGEMVFQNWYYVNGNGYWYDYSGVTHWANIPKPPCV